MKSVLKGVVRDHKLPSDYRANWLQPMNSVGFLKAFKRLFLTQAITRQHQKVPLFYLLGMCIPTCMFIVLYRWWGTGSLPQAFQPSFHLYRSNMGWYGYQHGANANPDNHWHRMSNRWTSDPACKLDIAPKRPWEDLKDPK